MARLLDQYNTTIAPAMAAKFSLDQQDGDPQAGEDRHQHGGRPGHPGQGRCWRRPSTAWARSAARSRWSPRPRSRSPGFRLREGNEIGCKVTLRGRRMYEFLDRLISIALPRIRDFRGRQPQQLRRPRQLHPGPGRAGRLPRDRRRQAPAHPGHGHHDRHHDRQRRPGPRAAPRPSACRSASPSSRRQVSLESSGRTERRTSAPDRRNHVDGEPDMSTKAQMIKSQTPRKFAVRHRNRCKLCGRPRAVYRKFGICRICFRNLASTGPDPGRQEGELVSRGPPPRIRIRIACPRRADAARPRRPSRRAGRVTRGGRRGPIPP